MISRDLLEVCMILPCVGVRYSQMIDPWLVLVLVVS